jgi:hypothetical protein
MAKVTRYFHDYVDHTLGEDENGDYVRREDYESLLELLRRVHDEVFDVEHHAELGPEVRTALGITEDSSAPAAADTTAATR